MKKERCRRITVNIAQSAVNSIFRMYSNTDGMLATNGRDFELRPLIQTVCGIIVC